VRGDVNVANTPAEISSASTERRKLNEHSVDQLLETSDFSDWVRTLNELHEQVYQTGTLNIRKVNPVLIEKLTNPSGNSH
jgi:transcriptional regulator of aromatic amino acid metabolism